MPHFRFSRATAIFCLVLFFLHAPFSAGQDAPESTAVEGGDGGDFAYPFMVKVDVNEIRLDVTVVDGRGNLITDLTARRQLTPYTRKTAGYPRKPTDTY